MRHRALLIAGFLGLLSATRTIHAQQSGEAVGRVRAEPQARSTTVYRLRDGKRVTFAVRGVGHGDASRGSLEMEYKNGRAAMHLEVDSLIHPQRVGAAYTAYVFWGVTADGKVTSLGELPVNKRVDLRADLTAQTVGALVTAEPYAEVERPSWELVLTFTLLNKEDKNAPLASSARYLSDDGHLYLDASTTATPDGSTPLLVQSARHAVAIARRAGAVEFAPAEWRQVDVKLEVLEQLWPDQRTNESKFSGPAREVIRLADAARRIGAERADSAAVAAERMATAASLARAASDVETARRLKAEAEWDLARARASADSANQVAALARASADSANQAAARTLSYADSVRSAAGAASAAAAAAAAAAQQQALAAQREALAARQERDAARARLASSISAILDTKRETRGLVVNLSDVLFTSGQAVLQPGARENLSRLSGILLAYPGPYTLAIGGHTDSVGSDAMNDKLSQARAESVRNYLVQAGIAASHVTSATGYGKHQPVADNATAEGRARNRRVEIVIDDTDRSVQ
jgi:outer membrane protein OmpA-like peptidoglycan-associated protein